MHSRNKLPVIVGGTNYYIESLLWKVLLDTGVSSYINKHLKYMFHSGTITLPRCLLFKVCLYKNLGQVVACSIYVLIRLNPICLFYYFYFSISQTEKNAVCHIFISRER